MQTGIEAKVLGSSESFRITKSAAFGFIVELISQSDYHSSWSMKQFYFHFLPPLSNDQAIIYFDKDSKPLGVMTWAFLDEEISAYMVDPRFVLQANQWDGGNVLWFVDVICPFGHVYSMISEVVDPCLNICHRLKTFDSVRSIRRNMDGSPRKVYCWNREQGKKSTL